MDAAPNYTTAALVMGGVNLFWILLLIRGFLGFGAVFAVGYALDRLIVWGARRRRRAR
ncbi:hypothetical protein [Roseovarius nitratireducens]|uniref:hypothetical protein n=1 Tax=Roseovarius nitratireducens TaxID=2044597 RepID=UPI0013EAA2F8|nr:hypothetical protein [Roseovarius nitratireducens]